jgi:hypothetical protein
MELNETVTVRGVLAFPYLGEQDNNGKYSLQIGNLSPAAVDKLESMGVDVKFKDGDKYGRGMFISSSSKFPFKPTDMEGKPIEPEAVGYGSTVVATVTTYPWTYMGKSGIGVRVLALAVEELESPATVAVQDPEEAL